MDRDRRTRDALIERMTAIQHDWEATILPDFIERILSVRLTTQQLKVLALVVPDPDGQSIQELATTLAVSLPTMSGLADRLAERGMIRRTVDTTDQRVRRVVATEPGREVIRRLVTTQAGPSHLPLDELSLPDLRALVDGLTALMAAIRTSRHP